jgi:transposase
MEEEPSVMQISTIGLDLAKSVFQVHGVDAAGEVVMRRKLRRSQVLPFFAGLGRRCLVGMEACASAHYWARELMALGHEVRLMPAGYVKAYVRRQKNDAADAAAICEAVTRPSMRFVAVKTAPAQAQLALHRTRALLVRQRTMLMNALRAHLAEFGHVAPQGQAGLTALLTLVEKRFEESDIPAMARPALVSLTAQIGLLKKEIDALERAIRAAHVENEASRRLASIPGIGPITASAILASVPDMKLFRSGREFAAFLGLTPRQNSSGGKERLGAISKKGDRYLRSLITVGATSLLHHRSALSPAHRAWLERLMAKKPARLASVALANKLARIAWALLVRGGVYRSDAAAAATA